MEELLRNHGLKVTTHRLEILNVLNELLLNATVKNIIDKTNMDVSTVYRTLKTLEDNNIIDKTIVNDEVVYTIKEEHRHYIKCIKCNKVTEIDECPFDVSNNIEGYKIVSHSLMIDGICDNCQK
ncbi:MAG: transcriptional repressor [Bacilli bacterium]|nr:transcriptional repressor [Bacilli bacterium]